MTFFTGNLFFFFCSTVSRRERGQVEKGEGDSKQLKRYSQPAKEADLGGGGGVSSFLASNITQKW